MELQSIWRWLWPESDQASLIPIEQAKVLVDNPPDLSPNADDDLKEAYIESLLRVADSDVQHLSVYLAFGTGVMTLFVGQLPSDRLLALTRPWRIAFCIGLALELVGAYLIFRYIREVHKARMKIARCVPGADAIRAREIWAGPVGLPARSYWRFVQGVRVLKLGVLLLALPIGAIYLIAPTAAP